MEALKQTFDSAVTMLVQLWNSFAQWGIFGGWLMFMAVLRKIGNTFNKLKSNGG